jgi:hypothetical protein
LITKEKKQVIEDAKVQREVTKQLKFDKQQAILKPKKGALVSKGKKKVVVVVESDIEYEELVEPRIWTPRPKRSKKMLEQFNNYDLS